MQQLFNINALLPKDQWLPDEPMIHEVKFGDMDSDVRLPKVSFGKEDEYVEYGSVSIYDDNNDFLGWTLTRGGDDFIVTKKRA